MPWASRRESVIRIHLALHTADLISGRPLLLACVSRDPELPELLPVAPRFSRLILGLPFHQDSNALGVRSRSKQPAAVAPRRRRNRRTPRPDRLPSGLWIREALWSAVVLYRFPMTSCVRGLGFGCCLTTFYLAGGSDNHPKPSPPRESCS